MVQGNDSSQNYPLGEADSIYLEYSLTQIVLVGSVTAILVRTFLQMFDNKLKVPFAGYRSVFEPSWLVRLRFSRGAFPMIHEGYRKVGRKQRRPDRSFSSANGSKVQDLVVSTCPERSRHSCAIQ